MTGWCHLWAERGSGLLTACRSPTHLRTQVCVRGSFLSLPSLSVVSSDRSVVRTRPLLGEGPPVHRGGPVSKVHVLTLAEPAGPSSPNRGTCPAWLPGPDFFPGPISSVRPYACVVSSSVAPLSPVWSPSRPLLWLSQWPFLTGPSLCSSYLEDCIRLSPCDWNLVSTLFNEPCASKTRLGPWLCSH